MAAEIMNLIQPLPPELREMILRVYLHKNKAGIRNGLESGASGAEQDPFLPKTRNVCEIEVLFRSFRLRIGRAL